jgi:hypothetical protein
VKTSIASLAVCIIENAIVDDPEQRIAFTSAITRRLSANGTFHLPRAARMAFRISLLLIIVALRFVPVVFLA